MFYLHHYLSRVLIYVTLSVGTDKDVTISISNDQLKLWTLDSSFAVEPGQFNVRIGTSDSTYINATLNVQ